MRFRYAFHDAANTWREGSIAAASREAAFAALRRQGIRPITVTLAPGVLNRILSFGKRGLAIAVLAVLLVVALVALFAPPPPASAGFVCLREETDAIVRTATNDVPVARAELRRLYRERFAALPESERDAAMSLFGRAMLSLDDAEIALRTATSREK